MSPNPPTSPVQASTRLSQTIRRARAGGFTLVEMLVATFVLVIILGMTLSITNYANKLLLSTRKKIDAFQESRAGFEVMTRKMSQAMLNTYWDYANGTVGSGTGSPRPQPGSANYATTSGSWQPTQFLRNSQLEFICGPAQAAVTTSGTVGPIIGTSANGAASPYSRIVGDAVFFQAPLGYSDVNATAALPNLLNSCGYFLQFSSDNPDRPSFLVGSEAGVATVGSDALPVKWRFRLKELDLSSEYMYMYQYLSTIATQSNYLSPNYTNWWYSLPLAKKNSGLTTLPFSPVYTLSQNVIALIIQPTRSANYPVPNGAPTELAPYYLYDSRAWASTSAATATSATAIATRNQLPPQVTVTMVAIDEASAARLQSLYGGGNGNTIPTFADSNASNPALPNGLYNSANGASRIFLQASSTPGSGLYDQYATDLGNLEQSLINQHITFRVFSTNVTILQSKFSD